MNMHNYFTLGMIIIAGLLPIIMFLMELVIIYYGIRLTNCVGVPVTWKSLRCTRQHARIYLESEMEKQSENGRYLAQKIQHYSKLSRIGNWIIMILLIAFIIRDIANR